MTRLRPRAIVSSLTSKGFVEVDGDHRRFVYYSGGKKTEIRTKISHNSRDLGEDLIHEMAKQTRLSKMDFVALVECSLSAEGYRSKLLEAGVRLEPATPSS